MRRAKRVSMETTMEEHPHRLASLVDFVENPVDAPALTEAEAANLPRLHPAGFHIGKCALEAFEGSISSTRSNSFW